MDYKILEDYLESISHYLVPKKDQSEILSEIKSHLLEKTKTESGEITNDTLKKAIENYGSPKTIAEQYLENYQIISPAYTKYLFHYTAWLFLIHYGLIIISGYLDYRLMFFPFFYIPVIGEHMPVWYQLILLIPMTFFYDFGLVCLFLYLVTRSGQAIKLPWLKLGISWLINIPEKIKRPKAGILGLLVLSFIAVVIIYLIHGTLFFLSVGWEEANSAFNPEASRWLSLAVIAIFLLEIVHYIIRFFTESSWIRLIKDSLILIILWLIINYPIEDALIDFPYLDLKTIYYAIILFFTVMAAINFLNSLVGVFKSKNVIQR